MTGLQKTSLSLLISLVVFGLFSLWAFSGLFSVIETSFFRQKIEDSVTLQLQDTDQYINEYIKTLNSDFTQFFGQDFMVGTFRVNQSAAENQARLDAIDQLRQKHSIAWIRVFDMGGQLHDSTLISDIKEQTPIRKEFLPSSELQLGFSPSELIQLDNPNPKYALDSSGNNFLFSIPIISKDSIRYGTALVAVTTRELSRFNERWSRTAFGDDFQLLNKDSVIVNMPLDAPAGLRAGLLEGLSQSKQDKRFRVQSGDGKAWVVYRFETSKQYFRLLYLVNAAELEFPFQLRIVLLVIVFLTVFLISFLLLNLKQDDMLVLSDRIKHLQVNLLKQYVENRGQISSERWQSELRSRREEVRASIKKGLGRRGKKDQAVDDLIDKGWDEILEILGSRKTNAVANFDISRLEDLVQKVISNYQVQLAQSGPESSGARTQTKPLVPTTMPVTKIQALPVESAADDLEEIDSLEEMEEVEEVEEVSEAEAIEEAEEFDEAEEVEEITEAEEIDEVEEIAEAEAVEEAEEVTELDEIAEDEDLPASVKTADDVVDLEDIPEAESLDDVDGYEATAKLMPLYDESIPAVIDYDLDDPHILKKKAKAEPKPEAAKISAKSVPVKPQTDEFEDVAELEELDDAEELVDLEDVEEAEQISAKESVPDTDEEDNSVGVEALEAMPLASSRVSFFANLGQNPTLRTIGKNPGNNLIANRAIPIESAKTLEELEMRCRSNLELKHIYDYTGAPNKPEWNFQSLESGVVRIPDEIYSRNAGNVRNQPLGTLVASIIQDSQNVETQNQTSIDGLLRYDPSIESLDDVDSNVNVPIAKNEDVPQEHRAYYRSKLELQHSLVLTNKGINFDSFLTHFRDDESGRIKALYTFSKRFKSESAILLRLELGGLRVQRTLGLSSESPRWLSFRNGGECLLELNSIPSIAFFNSCASLLQLIDAPSPDYRSLNRIVMVPMFFENQISYCLLGYTQELKMHTFLKDYIEQLPVEQID